MTDYFASQPLPQLLAQLIAQADAAGALPGDQGEPALRGRDLQTALLQRWPDDDSDLTERAVRPFVWRGSRLYLWRYACAEQQISHYIRRARQYPLSAQAVQSARQVLLQLFPADASTQAQVAPDSAPDWQLQACALAFARAFVVITGGPGTGKTTTVTKLLLLLLSQQPDLEILLAAPTGKAAARLTESISQSAGQFRQHGSAAADLVASQKAVTVHRLLAPKADGSGFHFGVGRYLPADVVIVDEASMLDITLFAALLAALSPQCRLILLGDKDQLASVEAGAVLSELCAHAQEGRYSTQTAQLLQALTGQSLPTLYCSASPDPLDQQVVMLRVSHRFASDSGIGALARLINSGDSRGVSQLLAQDLADLQQLQLSSPSDLTDFILQQLQPYLTEAAAVLSAADAAASAARLHQLASRFQLLTALRHGPDGSEQLNQAVEARIRRRFHYDSQELWYPGRAIIIRQNDYSSGLMNGDIGICCLVDHTLRLAFLQADGGIRWLLPGRLPAYEAAFVLTVHKSQGSEYQHAALLLPPYWSPVLSRELIYTAVTRARQQFSLICPVPAVLEQAIASKTARNGGLRLL